jgi:RNA polymerase sigma-70 factor (ECF subfamily)
MDRHRTTVVVQFYLDALADARGEGDAAPVISALLAISVRRLQRLCSRLLYRNYPRLARPPLGLDAEEMLGSVVERLLRALRQTRPRTVRGFFDLAGQHMRWELNDLARRLDEQARPLDVHGLDLAAPASSDSGLGPAARQMLDAIDRLPQDEGEALNLVRIHGLTHAEAAEMLGVSTKTIQRRVNRALIILTTELDDLRPGPIAGVGGDDAGTGSVRRPL